MVIKRLGMYFFSSLIGLTRRSSSDAPRNACPQTENVRVVYQAECPAGVNGIESAPVETWFEILKKQSDGMVVGRQKYAGLPDLEDGAPEIYETPDLTDDVSTAQTATQRTNSPSPSDDPDTGLDRQQIDRNEARRRFEPSLVDSRDVNFSDSLAGGRRSYKTGTRRRRRRRDEGAEELGDLSDSEDESLGRKLARLRREAEEVKLELQRREQKKAGGENDEEDEGLENGVEALNQMLDGLSPSSRGGNMSAEAALSKKLASGFKTTTSEPVSQQPAPLEPSPQRSTLASLATLSDRLTALETSLGLSTTTPTSSAPILSTLASLTSQITTLSTTLTFPSTTTNAGQTATTSTVNLDALTTRVRDLTTQTDRLTLSRKAATQAATDLLGARLKAAISSSARTTAAGGGGGGGGLPTPHPLSYSTTAAGESSSSQPLQPPHHRPHTHKVNGHSFRPETLVELRDQEALTSKVSALYSTLPRIAELSPLLPLVLERLRSLQTIHAGAAIAREDLEELERGQAAVQGGIEEWRGGLERLEGRVREGEGVMRVNVGALGEAVRAVEGRVKVLEG